MTSVTFFLKDSRPAFLGLGVMIGLMAVAKGGITGIGCLIPFAAGIITGGGTWIIERYRTGSRGFDSEANTCAAIAMALGVAPGIMIGHASYGDPMISLIIMISASPLFSIALFFGYIIGILLCTVGCTPSKPSTTRGG